jgi:hypothetical protein
MMTPWSSYRIDLERAPVRLWNAFGRIQAHGETLRGIRLTPDAAASLTRRWREPAAAATASILAGRDGTAAPFDGEIAAAIAALYGAIDDSIDRGLGNGAEFALRPEALCHDNTALAELAAAAGGGDSAADAGSMAAQFTEPATETWSRLGQFCRWLESPEFRATEADALQIAFLRAFGAVFHLSLMRPFRLCSGATADLLGYRMLRLAGLPPMTAHLPAVVRARRPDRFRELLVEAEVNNGGPSGFVTEAVAGVLDGMREQLSTAHEILADAAWRQYVDTVFRGRTGKADRRRRLLLDGLSSTDAPIRLGRLRRLTPSLAEAYAGRSEKTLSRDIIWLEQEGLLVRGLAGVRPRREALATLGQAA